jgi:hypothetical protein
VVDSGEPAGRSCSGRNRGHDQGEAVEADCGCGEGWEDGAEGKTDGGDWATLTEIGGRNSGRRKQTGVEAVRGARV